MQTNFKTLGRFTLFNNFYLDIRGSPFYWPPELHYMLAN